MTKIYIIGGPGSGKTTYAAYWAAQLNIPHIDLDDIKWDNHPGQSPGCKRTKEQRSVLLNNALKNKDWIMEGVYWQDWADDVYKQADEIIVLNPSIMVRHYRVIRRSIRRRLGVESNKYKEKWRALWELLKWSHVYNKKYLPLAFEKINKLQKPYHILKHVSVKNKTHQHFSNIKG